MKKSIFICHSSKDARLANQIVKILENEQVSCWIAPRDVPPGSAYNNVIIDAIEQCTVILFLLTENSNKSQHIRAELERGFSKGKVIIPVRMKDLLPSKNIEYFISTAQWLDVFGSPLKERLQVVVNITLAAEGNNEAPTIPPESRSVSGYIKRFAENLSRNPNLTISLLAIVFSILAFVKISLDDDFVFNYQSLLSGQKEQTKDLKLLQEQVSETKKETSDDPMKELANLGVEWKDFYRYMREGNKRVITLFFQAEKNLNKSDFEELVKYGITNSRLREPILTYDYNPLTLSEDLRVDLVETCSDEDCLEGLHWTVENFGKSKDFDRFNIFSLIKYEKNSSYEEIKDLLILLKSHGYQVNMQDCLENNYFGNQLRDFYRKKFINVENENDKIIKARMSAFTQAFPEEIKNCNNQIFEEVRRDYIEILTPKTVWEPVVQDLLNSFPGYILRGSTEVWVKSSSELRPQDGISVDLGKWRVLIDKTTFLRQDTRYMISISPSTRQYMHLSDVKKELIEIKNKANAMITVARKQKPELF